MICDNDKTIFEYLKPTSNDMLSKVNDNDLKEILYYLDKYYLEYRDSLEISNDISFGIEMEFEHFKGTTVDYWPFQLELNSIVGNNLWDSKNDITLKWGREIASDILYDNCKTWKDIDNVCKLASMYGEIALTCSAQVHVGSQILGNNPLYWYRFCKLWSIYENVIYRFGYGEYLTHRNRICDYAKPAALFLDSRLPLMKERINTSVNEMLYLGIKPNNVSVDELKKYGVSFWHMFADNDYNLFEDFSKFNYGCTTEFRYANGTFNKVVWQNEIMFNIYLMLYCKNSCFDEDILNGRKREVFGMYSDLCAYSKIYLKQAIELSDMIFNNNVDKIYFLRQYLKSFEISDRPFVKAKRFTM